MVKLNQILAIEKGEKTRSQRALTDLHHKSQKEVLYEGRVRSYKPLDEEGEQLPQERQVVQMRAPEVLAEQAEILTPLWDTIAAKDWSNATTRADVKVGETVLIKDCPVTYLLFLKVQLDNVETFLSKLPTLDPSEEWKFSPDQNCYVTNPSWTQRTKKVMRNHVKAPATVEHPAQVETYNEDVMVGRWETIRHSGALPVQRRDELIERVRVLKKAVLFAREQANAVEATKPEVAKELFSYLFA